MSRIIIEGVDKSGKSTIIEKMKNQFEYGLAIKNMIKPKDASEEETERIIDMYDQILRISNQSDLRNPSNHNFIYILDRFYQSEIVYSILRGNDRFEEERFMAVVDLWENKIAKDTLLVLLETDPAIVAERFKICKEDFVKEEQIKMLQERYNRCFEMSKLPKIKLDTTQLGIEKSLELIKQEIAKLNV